MELIYYAPSTEKTHETPMLMITSWINKFYILDLRPRNSLIRWLRDQGYPVFAISWVNPLAQHRHHGVDDYVQLGIEKAIEIILTTCQCSQVHTMGYCLGGTLLSIASSYLAANNKPWIASMSLVATLLDFSEEEGLATFMGPEQLAVYEKTLAKYHLWDGHKMQIGFNLTNSNQFIWPFAQRRYLYGKSAIAIDSVYWGLDLANTTEALYRFYASDLHGKNTLMTPNLLQVNGYPIDIHTNTVPTSTSLLIRILFLHGGNAITLHINNRPHGLS